MKPQREEPKKLRRGLKDVSSLFSRAVEKNADQNKEAVPGALAGDGDPPPCLCLFSPDFPEDSLLITSYLASQLAAQGLPCTVVSLRRNGQESFREAGRNRDKSSLRHVTLTWREWQGLWHVGRTPTAAGRNGNGSALVFVDFDSAGIPHWEKIIPLIDQWIVLVRPEYDSIAEAYKMMKSLTAFNRPRECFLLFCGSAKDRRGSLLYEGLGGLATKRLDMDLHWFGTLHLPESFAGAGHIGDKNLSCQLFTDPLLRRKNRTVDSLEKRALMELLDHKKNGDG